MNHRQAGFTIIETLLYVTLTVVVLAGAITATFGFVEASDREQKKTLREQEIAFVSRKLDWLLGGATGVVVNGGIATIINPHLGTSSPVDVSIMDGAVRIDVNDDVLKSLTSSWLMVTSVATPFTYSGGVFTAQANIGGENWNYTFYVR